jgi:hypothetical protein
MQKHLLEELSRLQPLVLYQIIRLFHGGLNQRITAEQQEDLLVEQVQERVSISSFMEGVLLVVFWT